MFNNWINQHQYVCYQTQIQKVKKWEKLKAESEKNFKVHTTESVPEHWESWPVPLSLSSHRQRKTQPTKQTTKQPKEKKITKCFVQVSPQQNGNLGERRDEGEINRSAWCYCEFGYSFIDERVKSSSSSSFCLSISNPFFFPLFFSFFFSPFFLKIFDRNCA